MTVHEDIIWVHLPPQETQEASVEPNMELLEALPNLPPGYYRKWCPKRGGWVTTQGEEEDDNQSQANLTRERYTDWWEEQIEAYKDMYGDYLLK